MPYKFKVGASHSEYGGRGCAAQNLSTEAETPFEASEGQGARGSAIELITIYSEKSPLIQLKVAKG
jgi:hypothetical protein